MFVVQRFVSSVLATQTVLSVAQADLSRVRCIADVWLACSCATARLYLALATAFVLMEYYDIQHTVTVAAI